MSDAPLAAEEFITLLADQIAKLGPATRQIGGSVRFTVPGAGDWLLSLDAPNGRWALADAKTDADVQLVIPAEHLAAFFTAPDTLEPLGASGDIAVSGDVDKLVALGSLLSERGSALSQRIKDKGAR